MSKDENKWKKIVEEIETKEKDKTSKVANKQKGQSKQAAEDAIETIEEVSLERQAELEAKIRNLESKVAELTDRLARGHAEIENIRRRAARDVAHAHKYGSEKLLSDMLPILDSLIRGLEGISATDQNMKAVREGMQLTLDMFVKSLEKHGVQQIFPEVGEDFNPDLHEAMSILEVAGAETNTIVEVLQRGFMLNGRVLRAARVIVAK